MASITLNNITFEVPVTENQTVTVLYKLASAPDEDYQVWTTGAVVLPNGSFQTPVVITGLSQFAQYEVKVVNNCDTSFAETTVGITTTTTTSTTLVPPAIIQWELISRHGATGSMSIKNNSVVYFTTDQENTSGQFEVNAGFNLGVNSGLETALWSGAMIENITEGTILYITEANGPVSLTGIVAVEAGKTYKVTVILDLEEVRTYATWTYTEYNGAQGEGRIYRDGELLLGQVMTNQGVGSEVNGPRHMFKPTVTLLSGNQTRIKVTNTTDSQNHIVLYDELLSGYQEYEFFIDAWEKYEITMHVNNTAAEVCRTFTTVEGWTQVGDPPDYEPF